MTTPNSRQLDGALTWGGLALLAYLLYLVLEPFLVPLGWACVLAVMLHPLHARLSLRMGPGRAAALTTLAATLLLIGPALLLANSFAREAIDIARAALAGGQTTWPQRAWDAVVQRVPSAAGLDVGAELSGLLRQAATFLMAQSGAFLTNVALFFVDLALALFATFFLLRDADDIMHGVRRLLPMSAEGRELFIHRTTDLITAGVTSSVIVAALQGLLGGIAFALVGISAPIFWGVVMGFFCLLPFGAWVIWLPAAIILGVSGSITKGLVLVGLGFGIVGTVDNVVRPLLLSGSVQMNGLVIFVSLLGGMAVFGLLGIVLGPIVVVTALTLVSGYVNEPEPEHTSNSGSRRPRRFR